MTDYGPDDIVLITGLEHIRMRPGMYVGSLDSEGIVVLLRELVDNALDMHLAGRCRTIGVSLGLPLRVWDEGPGFPEAQIGAFTELHIGNTRDGHAPHVHIGGFGVGLVIVNALSRVVTLETWQGERLRRWRFVEQALVEESWHHLPHTRASVPWTTRLGFEPDASILGAALPTRVRVLEEFGHLPWLFPTLRLELDGERLEQPEGLRGWVRAHGGERVDACVLERPGMRVEAAWGEARARDVAGFVNCRASPLGSHARGLEHGLARARGVPVGQLRERLVGIVHVVATDPRFAGPTRETFQDADAERWIAEGIAAHASAKPA
jgi:DNA gyrase/topoisomerase IV subunit B